MKNIAPWRDFFGNVLCEGDLIRHPDGSEGNVTFDGSKSHVSDHWKVSYSDGQLSRLCLQIGDKGMARKVTSFVSDCIKKAIL